MLLSIHLLLSFTITHPFPNQQVHSLHLCLYSCPANRLIITIFHDSMCLVAQSCLTLCDPMDCSPAGSSVHGNSPGKNTGVGCHAILEWVAMPYWSGLPCLPPGDPPNSGMKSRSPILQEDSLPSEKTGKPKSTGAGSQSLLLEIFPSQESNWDLLNSRCIIYQLSYQGSLIDFIHTC